MLTIALNTLRLLTDFIIYHIFVDSEEINKGRL